MTQTISPRKRIWGWYFFDWASQPYNTLLLTFVFGPYFAEVARGYYLGAGLDESAAKAAAQAFWGYGLAAASVVIAVLAPILGAVADGSGRRMMWIWLFSAFYVVGAYGLWWVMPGGEIGTLYWAVAFFALGFIGMELTTIFTNALMPSLGGQDDIGQISGTGFAFGYLGGFVALIVMLTLFAENAITGKTLIGIDPIFGLDTESREGTRMVGPLAALWYGLFMIPFFLWVREPRGGGGGIHIGAALGRLGDFIASLRFRKSLMSYLASALVYRDALNALYGFGGVYASNVLGWSITQIGVFGILGVVAAVVASWIGGRLDRAFGPKPVILGAILVLIGVCIVIVGLTRESLFGIAIDPASGTSDVIFMVCGALIGAAGGPLQAASRTMLLRHTTPDRATEAFGIFALSGKVTSFVAPLLIAIVTQISGSARIGISPIIFLFIVGIILLIWVRPRGEMA
jgi:MFS transporter, UMF1 family